MPEKTMCLAPALSGGVVVVSVHEPSQEIDDFKRRGNEAQRYRWTCDRIASDAENFGSNYSCLLSMFTNENRGLDGGQRLCDPPGSYCRALLS